MSLEKSKDYIINALLVLIICLGLGVISLYLLKDYFAPSQLSEEKTVNLMNIVSEGIYSYTDENGLIGLATEDRQIILTAEWNRLSPLPDDNTRFLVAHSAGGRKLGIIDIEGNLISPYIYTKIAKIDENILLGYTSDNNTSAVLLDGSGNRYANEEWDSIQCYSGNYVVLTKNNSEYGAVISNGKLIIRTITYKLKLVGDTETNVSILPSSPIAQVNIDVYNKIIRRSADFITALFSVYKSDFGKYCTPQFAYEFDMMNDYKSNELLEISFINPEIIEGDGSMTYRSNANFKIRHANGEEETVFAEMEFMINDSGIMLISDCTLTE